MLSLKKTTLAMLAFSSSMAFAGTMGPVCTPGNVTVPCEHTGWAVGGQALYLQTLYSNPVSFLSAINPDSINFDSKWNWGFQIEGSYYFNTGNDITLNWYHLDSKTQRVNTTLSTVEGDLAPVEFALRDRWDAVNGEFGQFVDFSANKKIRFHGGFQYARVKPGLGFVDLEDATTSLSYVSQFNGFGPRTGIDMNYVFGNGFGIYAKAATALLIGKHKSNTFVTAELPEDTVSLYGSRTGMVTELDAKLGANYVYSMAPGDLVLDAGYMWFNYLNALRHSDFAASGVYFGLKYVGNI